MWSWTQMKNAISTTISDTACGPVIVLTTEILFNVTEATSIWAVDKCMSMLLSILRREKKKDNNQDENHTRGLMCHMVS